MSAGFGKETLLEVSDSWAIAGQIAVELNIPHSDKLEEAVVGIIAAAKDERNLLFRTEGVLAGDLLRCNSQLFPGSVPAVAGR